MKRKKSLIILLVIFLITLNGCKDSQTTSLYETVIDELTAPELQGRLTGTDGNKKAQITLMNHFTDIGLKPYGTSSYLQSYSHRYFDPDKQRYAIKLEYTDGHVRELEYGKHYLEQVVPHSGSVKGRMTMDPRESDKDHRVVVLENSQHLAQLDGWKPEALLIRTETFKKMLPTGSPDRYMFQISPEIYQLLQKEQPLLSAISLESSLQEETISAHNIIGMIPGTGNGNHKDAIILSAHFDGLGRSGNQTYSSAIDNASGVSGLMGLAYNLKEYTSKKRISTDIIFALFNGEESGLQGSRAFARSMTKEYTHMIHINLDCIGTANGGTPVLAYGSTGSTLAKRMEQYFTEHKFEVQSVENGLSSDHLASAEQGIPAVTLGQTGLSTLHTVHDTSQDIDWDELHRTVTAVFNYIVTSGHEEHDTPSTGQPVASPQRETSLPATRPSATDKAQAKEQQQMIESARKSMRLGQYQQLSLPDGTFPWVTPYSGVFHDQTEAEALIKGLTLPDSLLNTPVRWVRISANVKLDDQLTGQGQPGTIYTLDELPMDDVFAMDLFLEDGDNEGLLIRLTPLQELVEMHSENTDLAIRTEETTIGGRKVTITANENHHLFMVTTDVEVEGSRFYTQLYRAKVSKESSSPDDPILQHVWTSADRDQALETAARLPLEQWITDMGLSKWRARPPQ